MLDAWKPAICSRDPRFFSGAAHWRRWRRRWCCLHVPWCPWCRNMRWDPLKIWGWIQCGHPNSWMVWTMETIPWKKIQMDSNWGYPYFRKPMEMTVASHEITINRFYKPSPNGICPWRPAEAPQERRTRWRGAGSWHGRSSGGWSATRRFVCHSHLTCRYQHVLSVCGLQEVTLLSYPILYYTLLLLSFTCSKLLRKVGHPAVPLCFSGLVGICGNRSKRCNATLKTSGWKGMLQKHAIAVLLWSTYVCVCI